MIDVPFIGMGPTAMRPVAPSPLDVDPYDERARRSRIQGFQSYMAQNPGAAPGGTGSTGLAMNDAAGWSRLLEQQQQYAKDLAAESGKAAPTTRFTGYSGGVLSGLKSANAPVVGGPFSASQEKGPMPPVNTAALKGLGDVLDFADPTQMRQLANDVVQDQRSQLARRAPRVIPKGDPANPFDYDWLYDPGAMADWSAAESDLADTKFDPIEHEVYKRGRLGAVDRDNTYDDIVSEAAAKSRGYFGFGRAVAQDQNDMAAALADRKGNAASIDDLIRAAASRDVAGINAGSRDRATAAGQSNAALAALNGQINNQRQYGDVDPNTLGEFNRRASGAPGGMPGAAAPSGAPVPGGRVLTRQQVLDTAQQNGWTEEQAMAQARLHGYTVR